MSNGTCLLRDKGGFEIGRKSANPKAVRSPVAIGSIPSGENRGHIRII
jgi:hypothetical protein